MSLSTWHLMSTITINIVLVSYITLPPQFQPGNIIIIDNATFHKADATPRRKPPQGKRPKGFARPEAHSLRSLREMP